MKVYPSPWQTLGTAQAREDGTGRVTLHSPHSLCSGMRTAQDAVLRHLSASAGAALIHLEHLGLAWCYGSNILGPSPSESLKATFRMHLNRTPKPLSRTPDSRAYYRRNPSSHMARDREGPGQDMSFQHIQ